MKKNLIVAGSRRFSNLLLLETELNKIIQFGKKNGYEITIFSGNARGADKMAVEYAKANKLPYLLFLPQWETSGKVAGVLRNIEMSKTADFCLCFWDGISPGTNHMRKICKRKHIPLRTVYY
jgi:hypothetical protein